MKARELLNAPVDPAKPQLTFGDAFTGLGMSPDQGLLVAHLITEDAVDIRLWNDVDPLLGRNLGCTRAWVNTDEISTLCPKLSTRTGLIYTQDGRYDAENELYAVCRVALDFRTGKVVWEKLAGTFGKSASPPFDNFWSGIGIGPDGAMFGGQYGGITMIRDTD